MCYNDLTNRKGVLCMPENMTYQDYEKDCDTLLHLCKLAIISSEEYETIWNKITKYYINQNKDIPQMSKALSLVI